MPQNVLPAVRLDMMVCLPVTRHTKLNQIVLGITPAKLPWDYVMTIRLARRVKGGPIKTALAG